MIDLRNLMRLSLFDPRQGAGLLLSYQLSTEAVFYLFAASVCVSTAMMFGMQILLTNGEAAGLIAVASPWMFALLVAGMTMMVCGTISWTGQKFEGTGDFRAVFTVMAWLQVLQLVFQAAFYLSMLSLPALAAIVQLGTFLWSLWIFVAFIDRAHEFNSMGKAALVAFLGSSLGVVVIVLFISLFGFM